MSLSLTLFNAINQVLPYRGFFALRRGWLRSAGLQIGRNVRIAAGARIYDIYISIGDDAWVGPEVSIVSTHSGPIAIGSHVDLAPGVMLVSGAHELGEPDHRAGNGTGAPIVIGDGTWVGARTVILGGASIGRGCVVAAGAVVIAGHYPDNVLLAGVPASVKKVLPSSGMAPASGVTVLPAQLTSGHSE